jgi:hypothetical protein
MGMTGGGPNGPAAPKDGPPARKGRPDPKPGESLIVRCWVLIRPPCDGTEVNTGHQPVPGDGGRAKFFLIGQFGEGTWLTLLPNGMESLDQTPPLTFATEPTLPPIPEEPADPAAPAGSDYSALIVLAIAAVILVVLGGFAWFRRSPQAAPEAPPAGPTSPANPA